MDGRKDKERVKRERVCARKRNEVRAKKSKKERVCVASTLCVWCMAFWSFALGGGGGWGGEVVKLDVKLE